MKEYIRQILDAVKLDKPENELEEMLNGIFREIEDRYRRSDETGQGNEGCSPERPDRYSEHLSQSHPSENYQIPDEDKEYISELRDTKIDDIE